MSGLYGITKQHATAGRIRIGYSEATGRTGKSGQEIRKPVKHDTFIISTPLRSLIDQVAELYGGEVQDWEPQGGGSPQWRVFTDVKQLPVILPPDALSQYYELWIGGSCRRRCDGRTNLLTDKPCLCALSEKQDCKPTTRLNVMLAHVATVGVWRLEAHGYYAAAQIPPVVDLLKTQGLYVPAMLSIVEQSKKIEGKPIQKWMVPHLDVVTAPAAQITGTAHAFAIAQGVGPLAIEAQPADVEDDSDSFVVDGEEESDLEAGPDPAVVFEAQTCAAVKMIGDITALRAFYARLIEAGTMTPGIAEFIKARATQVEQKAAAKAADSDVVDAEIVEVDARKVAWTKVITAASAAGWKQPRLLAEFQEWAGVPVSDGTAEQFADFAVMVK